MAFPEPPGDPEIAISSLPGLILNRLARERALARISCRLGRLQKTGESLRSCASCYRYETLLPEVVKVVMPDRGSAATPKSNA